MAVSVRVLYSYRAATVKSRRAAREVSRTSRTLRIGGHGSASTRELGESSMLPTNAVAFES